MSEFLERTLPERYDQKNTEAVTEKRRGDWTPIQEPTGSWSECPHEPFQASSEMISATILLSKMFLLQSAPLVADCRAYLLWTCLAGRSVSEVTLEIFLRIDIKNLSRPLEKFAAVWFTVYF